jgi:hypothetical protein
MTCYETTDAPSSFDLPLHLATARMAALRSERRRSGLADEGPPDGAFRRLRHGIGHRLIALGSILVADRRSRTLAR